MKRKAVKVITSKSLLNFNQFFIWQLHKKVLPLKYNDSREKGLIEYIEKIYITQRKLPWNSPTFRQKEGINRNIYAERRD